MIFLSGVKILLRIICFLIVLLINLNLLKPSFAQSKVEFHNLSLDGSINGAISIMFPEGWSTYWKFPGPNGFIPNIRLLSKENLKSFFGGISERLNFEYSDHNLEIFGFCNTCK